MKYLKTFEELSPETYLSAADKLSAMGEESRSEKLREYVNSKFFKEFIDRQQKDVYFKEAVQEIMKTPEYQNFKEAAEKNPEELDNLIRNAEKIRDAVLEHEKEEGVPFKRFTPEEKKSRFIAALKNFGIGTLLATLGSGVIALEQHLGSDGALSAMLGGFLASSLGIGIMQTGIALAPRKD